jgi:MFS family permease
MRMVALSWLVLQLTHSGTQLGLMTAAQFLPILLFGAFGGVIVDRMDNKRLLVFTQVSLGLVSLVLGILIMTHSVELWMVYVLSILSGLITVVDNPARQTFVVQMVGEDQLRNAVTLNSTIVNTARIIGPSIAAGLIAGVGMGWCFMVDAATFGAVLVALLMMKRTDLHLVEQIPKARGQIRAGFKYAMSTPALRTTLLMMVIIGTFAYEFPVILPLVATRTFHGNATTYAAMTAAMGIGAVVGGLYSASKGTTTMHRLILMAALFGVSIIVTALAPDLAVGLFLLVFVGFLSVLFISLGNTTLQLTSEPQMRGRVMALWSIAFQGTTPIGGPIIGAIADHSNPRVGLMVGGVSSIVAAGIGLFVAGYKLPRKPSDATVKAS